MTAATIPADAVHMLLTGSVYSLVRKGVLLVLLTELSLMDAPFSRKLSADA